MPWFRIDDDWHSHPKVLAAGNAASGLWARCGSYCSDHNLEGRIPKLLARHYGTQREIDRLLTVGLWRDDGDAYVMPDWLDYNPSKQEVDERRQKRAEAGRLGGLRSGHTRRSKNEANASQLLEAKTNPDPTRPDPSNYISTDDDSLTTRPPPSSSSSLPASIELLASAIAAKMATKRTDINNRRTWINATAQGLIRERRPELERLLHNQTTLETAVELLTSDPNPPPKELHEAWYTDPTCECGDGWRNNNGTLEPCTCRRSEPYTATIHTLHREAL